MYLMSWSSFVIVIMAYTFQFFFFELCILFCAHYLFVYLFDGIKKEKSVYFINEPLLIQSYMSVLRMYKEYLFTLERYIACCMHILPYTEWHAITTADALFAECWGHSTKPAKHSAKALPSAALGKGLSAKILSAKISLPSAKNRHSAKSLPSANPVLGKKITAVNF